MDEELNKPYLGKGWYFPPTINSKSNQTNMISEEEDIRQSLIILLSTRPGERVMRPGFGCNLDIMLFEPLTTSLKRQVQEMIRNSILYYEARIGVNRIDIISDNEIEGKILIKIDYLVRNTNSRFNLVYPFYIDEGVNNQLII